MRENLTYGSMRGDWKPGMVAGTEAPPERKRGEPPGAGSHAMNRMPRGRGIWICPWREISGVATRPLRDCVRQSRQPFMAPLGCYWTGYSRSTEHRGQ